MKGEKVRGPLANIQYSLYPNFSSKRSISRPFSPLRSRLFTTLQNDPAATHRINCGSCQMRNRNFVPEPLQHKSKIFAFATFRSHRPLLLRCLWTLRGLGESWEVSLAMSVAFTLFYAKVLVTEICQSPDNHCSP